MSQFRNYCIRKINFCVTFSINEMLSTGSTRPVFLVSVRHAGSVFLWSMCQTAMLHCHRTGIRKAAVHCFNRNCGSACAHGSHFATCIHRGNIAVTAFPCYGSIVSIGRLHRGGGSVGAAPSQGQRACVSRHARNRDRGRRGGGKAQLLAVRAPAVRGLPP